jgi:hypothetical protein
MTANFYTPKIPGEGRCPGPEKILNYISGYHDEKILILQRAVLIKDYFMSVFMWVVPVQVVRIKTATLTKFWAETLCFWTCTELDVISVRVGEKLTLWCTDVV